MAGAMERPVRFQAGAAFLTAKPIDGDMKNVEISGVCVFTHRPYSCIVPAEGFRKFVVGDHAQVAFPDLDIDTREFLISGIAPGAFPDPPEVT